MTHYQILNIIKSWVQLRCLNELMQWATATKLPVHYHTILGQTYSTSWTHKSQHRTQSSSWWDLQPEM